MVQELMLTLQALGLPRPLRGTLASQLLKEKFKVFFVVVDVVVIFFGGGEGCLSVLVFVLFVYFCCLVLCLLWAHPHSCEQPPTYALYMSPMSSLVGKVDLGGIILWLSWARCIR